MRFTFDEINFDCKDIHSGLIYLDEVVCFMCHKELIDTNAAYLDRKICRECKSDTLISVKTSDTLVCSKCGLVSDISNFTFSYDDFARYTIRKKCIYKREGNFNVILNQFLCIQNQKVPDEVLITLWDQISNKDNMLYNYTIPLSIPILEFLLKKNKMMVYKKSIFYIYFKLMNRPFPYLRTEERNRARRMFTVASHVYNKQGFDGKKSFMNYYFVLKKILIVLGKNDYAKYIPQLKTLPRQKELERVWNLITKDPEWVAALQKQRIA